VNLNVVLRGIRVIDPLAARDQVDMDVWLRSDRIQAIERRIRTDQAPTVDLARVPGLPEVVLCPGFIDLHTHLREPGGEAGETVRTGAEAAAAGGFTQLVAMANTRPPVDTPERVAEARRSARPFPVRVLSAAAVTTGLHGRQLVDTAGCAAAGAAAFTDDGRNAAPTRLLAAALRGAAEVDRAVLVHPEDETMVAAANPDIPSVVRCPHRPPECEVVAVEQALRALTQAGRGRLHLQHLSCAGSLALLRTAKELDFPVTAEVTPHHLSMWLPFEREPDPPALRKVNPPLRGERDRRALVEALRTGLVDAVATDHAPHPAEDKLGDYADAAPGMVGLETAVATCLTLGGMGGEWLPTLVERLTAGPWRVLGAGSGLREPRLRVGQPGSFILLDPDEEWEVGAEPMRSLSGNTPLLGERLRGRVLLTVAEGTVVHVSPSFPLAGVAEAVAGG
jgi:dihydroorotase